MSDAREAWDNGFAAGLLYSKQAWWRVPRPKNPYPEVDNSDIDAIVLRGDLPLDPEPYVFQASRFAERDQWGDRRFAPREGYEQDGRKYLYGYHR